MREQSRHVETRGPMSPTERLARIRALMRRGLAYSKGSLAIFLVGAAVAVGVARNTRPVYRAECTVFAKARIRTDDRDDGAPSPDQIVRQGARLKDMLTTRGRLEMAIKTFHLYPETVANKSMLDAVEEMKPHVGFRSLEGALYVISFDGNQPDLVQKVTQYLSDTLIDDYAAGDLDDLRRDADFLEKEERSSLEGPRGVDARADRVSRGAPRVRARGQAGGGAASGRARRAGSRSCPRPRPGAPAGTPSSPRSTASTGVSTARRRARARRTLGPAVLVGQAARRVDLAQAQASVEAAAKRVAESQADLASKSNLTEDHPGHARGANGRRRRGAAAPRGEVVVRQPAAAEGGRRGSGRSRRWSRPTSRRS